MRHVFYKYLSKGDKEKRRTTRCDINKGFTVSHGKLLHFLVFPRARDMNGAANYSLNAKSVSITLTRRNSAVTFVLTIFVFSRNVYLEDVQPIFWEPSEGALKKLLASPWEYRDPWRKERWLRGKKSPLRLPYNPPDDLYRSKHKEKFGRYAAL